MLSRSQVLPAGLCVLLAASLIALPGCGGSSSKRTAKPKADTAPIVTAKGSEEVAAENAAPVEVASAPIETAPAPAPDSGMSADAAMPAPEASSADLGGSTRGRAFDEAPAAPAPGQPAMDAAPSEEPPAPAKRAATRSKRRPAKARPAPAPVDTSADISAPAAGESDAGGAAAGAYVVAKGDTISKIARTHHTTARKLMAANHISDPRTLKVGQKLAIP